MNKTMDREGQSDQLFWASSVLNLHVDSVRSFLYRENYAMKFQHTIYVTIIAK